MSIINRLEYELRFVRGMKINSENFEILLKKLILMVSNTSEHDLSDDVRGLINVTLQDIDRYYGRKVPKG